MTAVARTVNGDGDLTDRLRAQAKDRPDRPALVADDRTVTYGELDARVDAGAAALQERGIAPGDRVAVIEGTTVSFVEAVLAIQRAGAVAVPLLPELAPGEIEYVLADSGTRCAVVGPDRATAVDGLVATLPDLADVIVTDGAVRDLPDRDRWDDLVVPGRTPTPVERPGDGLAALVYTSGTTGRPRGAMLTRENLTANQDQSLAGRFEVDPGDVVLLTLPLAHIYALNVGLGATITVGATAVLVERFDPSDTVGTITATGVTVILGAPTMYLAWLESGALDAAQFARVRLAVSGAAPLPVPTIERFREVTGVIIEEGYGLTEASPSVSSTAMVPTPVPGSVGLPLPDVELRLVDDDGRIVAAGDLGEVQVRGPNVFAGYWNDPEATAAAFTDDGFLRTRDVGVRDRDGLLRLVDRLDDLIVVHGFNVYPGEVERVLRADPSVAAAGVVGAPHPLTGETVIASVVPRTGHEVDVDRLHASCRAHLARYKCPTQIEVVADLPTTATGKLRRGELRDEPSEP